MRSIKCRLLIRFYRLRQAHATAYIAYGSHISPDLIAHEYTYVGHESIIGRNVTLGAYSMVGPRVLCLGDDHRFDLAGVPTIFAGRPALRQTLIGRDVWIGAGSIVLSGIEIGDGAIVAAGTVVSRHIPPCEIHGGAPNHKIRDRFQSAADRQQHLEFLREPPIQGRFPEGRYQ